MAVDVMSRVSDRRITCESEITNVSIYARGALITRTVHLPEDVPDGATVIEVPGITLAANGNSGRALLRAPERRLISLVSEVEVPLTDLGPGVSEERVREIERRIARIDLEITQLRTRRQEYAALSIAPQRTSEWRELGPLARVERALELAHIVNEHVARLDERIADLTLEREHLDKERRAANIAHAQTSNASDAERGRPSWSFLAHTDGEGPIERMELTYVVQSARWWPLYTLQLRDGGRAAELFMEAVVSQRTGEDWTRAALSLSTADLIQDARLPELPALKLGKTQPPKRSGYREAPKGLERLFSGYDTAKKTYHLGGEVQPERKPAPAKPPQVQPPTGAVMPSAPPPPRSFDRSQSLDDDEVNFDVNTMDLLSAEEARGGFIQQAMAAPVAKKSASIFSAFGSSGGGGVPGAPQSAPMMRKERTKNYIPEPEPELEPADSWLDFDRLEMPGPDEHARGRLRQRTFTRNQFDTSMDDALKEAGRLGVHDPYETRGTYDHRFDTQGLVDIPSDGKLHRLEVTSAAGVAKHWWRTVPLERDEVFRMARVLNPLEAPLLKGPLDVFVEGSFLLSTQLDHVDRGGNIIVGLGVDDRIKVARNVRVDEENIGLLGGKTAVSHTITIDISSNLPFSSTVEVIDRVPITYQDHLEIEDIETTPQAKVYSQKREGTPIKGGRRWKVQLDQGEETSLELRFKLVFSAKEEIVGGNRRE